MWTVILLCHTILSVVFQSSCDVLSCVWHWSDNQTIFWIILRLKVVHSILHVVVSRLLEYPVNRFIRNDCPYYLVSTAWASWSACRRNCKYEIVIIKWKMHIQKLTKDFVKRLFFGSYRRRSTHAINKNDLFERLKEKKRILANKRMTCIA